MQGPRGKLKNSRRDRWAATLAFIGLSSLAWATSACSPKTTRIVVGAEGLGQSAGFQLSPPAASVALWGTQSFTPSGGTPPYTYRLQGSGTLDSSGNFTAPGVPGTSTITTTDSTGLKTTSQITVTMGNHVFANDLYFDQIWPFTTSAADLGFTTAWSKTTDCSKILIGIVDTGIDPNQPDLMGNVSAGLSTNLVDNNSNAADIGFHGTAVAGIIGAVGNNGAGVTGVCWKAQLVSLLAFDDTGTYQATPAISAVNYAASHGIKILVYSWEDNGGSSPQGESALFTAALQAADTAGILVIAAAGDGADPNNGYAGGSIDQATGTPVFPGSLSSEILLTVGAVNQNDQLAPYSNYGPNSVQIAAPGDSILSTLPSYTTGAMTAAGLSGDYGFISSSAMAAAYVAGAAALAWSSHPTLSAPQLKSRILSYADTLPSLTGTIAGGKRLNVGKLVVSP